MGNLLGSPVVDKETHVGRTDEGLEFGVSSMQGWRIHMEDAHICESRLYAKDGETKTDLPGHSLFAVFDGHGGTFAAEYAGANMLRVLSRQSKFIQYAIFHHERQTQEPLLAEAERVQYVRAGLDLLEGAFRDAFVEIDCEIFKARRGQWEPDAYSPYHPPTAGDNHGSSVDDKSDSNSQRRSSEDDDDDSGTTAVVVMITPQWILCANAGDSRAVASKQSGKAVPLSYDHKPDDSDEQRRIQAAGGHVSGGRVEGDLAVSRGLGDFRFKIPSTVLQANNPLSQDQEGSDIVKPDDQKVSPIPDIIVQNRNVENDEFIVVACDGIWDVQTNYECVKMIADIFLEGETDLGLLCEEVCCSSWNALARNLALCVIFVSHAYHVFEI
jgi:serine/threonine protein phosphatase PrpC